MLSKTGANLADGTLSKKEKVPYTKSPVVVLSKDAHHEIAQGTVDTEGHFRITLAPGDYTLDLQPAKGRRVLVSKRAFTVVAGQTVHVDIEVESAIEPD